MMERGVRRKSHAPCEAGEKVAITSKSYLSLSERMEQNGSKVIPLRKSLPDSAYVYVESEDCIGRITKGDAGYKITDYGQNLKESAEKKFKADQLNKQSRITKAQIQAMIAGSMFGWDKPAADPKNYDAEGNLIKPKNKDRGDAR